MSHRDPDTTPTRFSAEPWRVCARGLDPARNQARESQFALGNGYLGWRAQPEEGFEAVAGRSVPGTYLNGFHECSPITYPESAYGYARWRQTMLNLPDARRVELTVDGERVSLARGTVEGAEETLELRDGTVVRSYRWTAPSGASCDVRLTRAVSLPHPRRAAWRLEVTPREGAITLGLQGGIDGRVENLVERDDPRVGGALAGRVLQQVEHGAEGAQSWLRMRAPGSGMEMACAAVQRLHVADEEVAATRVEAEPARTRLAFEARVPQGATARFETVAAYLDARYEAPDALVRAVRDEADASDLGALLAAQRAYLDAFWEASDVVVDGDDAIQQGVRYALFGLLGAAGRDGRTNVPAKGLTGEGYEGHTFWDTEIYVLPVLLHTRPEAAKALVAHRSGLLPAARARAAELRHAGALYPWRTIAGPEASAFFPAGTAQYHINADVAHAFERYLEATGDLTAFRDGAAAAVWETARFWRGLGAYGRDGAFHLHTVTGPDEYTALVDDDHYTNVLARAHLRFAARLAEALPGEAEAPSAEEAEDWRRVAEAMAVPVDRERGVHPQDASFLEKPAWPFAEVPRERHPLLLHYHPLDLYRHQVSKQPSVILAGLLRPEATSRAQLRRDLAYYEPRTTHDSSLSPCIHGIVAAQLGDTERALRYLRHTARLDLDDLAGNVRDGLHAAAMGGTWMGLVMGFGGFVPDGEVPTFHPRLPAGWAGFSFRFAWRGRRLEVSVAPDVTRYRLLAGEALEVRHRGEPLRLGADAPVERPTRPRLRGVAFDLDGVLTDTAEQHYLAWKALADELDIPFDRAANEALRGIDRMGSLELLLARGSRTASEAEKAALAERKNDLYRRAIADIGPGDLAAGGAELLDALREAGMPVAIASASRNAPAVLEGLGIAGRVDAVVDPAALTRGKPDPEIYLRAAELLGVPPEDCVGIEDAVAGVQAVSAAGMAAVGVGEPAALPEADTVVRGVGELGVEALRAALEG